MDQPVNAILQLDKRAKRREFRDTSRNQFANGVFGFDAGPGIVRKLSHAQGDALLGGVDIQDDCLDFLPLLQHLAGVVDLTRPRHVRDMDHAVDVVLNLHEGPVRSHVPDLALDLRPLGERLGNHLPRVHHGLAQSERNLAGILLDVEHDPLNLVANLQNIAGTVDLLGPRHL